MMDAIAARVAGGETVEFRPTGNSMVPLIQSRQNVRVEPVGAELVGRGVQAACLYSWMSPSQRGRAVTGRRS